MKNKNEKETIQNSLLTMDFSKLSTLQIIKLIFAGIFTIVLIIGFFQNFSEVEIKFLFWEFSLSKSLLILICVFIGGIIAYFRDERKSRKKNKIIKALQKKISEIENER